MTNDSLRWIETLSLEEVRAVTVDVQQLLASDLAETAVGARRIEALRDVQVGLGWKLGQEIKAALAVFCAARPDSALALRRAVEERRRVADEIVVADPLGIAGLLLGMGGIVATFIAAHIFSTGERSPVTEELVASLVAKIESLEQKLDGVSSTVDAPRGSGEQPAERSGEDE